ncbi:MAG: hypothetical protein CMB64_05885 [Euryarchaeota archaeon]|nr:hypothetical protein [Euryarchaeota archaeon]|tara:strand:+ start:262 stop:600 length:339 start_codon:yes stop_codon:yes gene_type:complete
MNPFKNLIKILIGNFRPIRIKGQSMEPALSNGQIVWVDYSKKAISEIKKDDIVLFRNPLGSNLIVKRVSEINLEKGFWMRGDNRFPLESTDSEKFGYVKKTHLKGKILSKNS